MLGIAAMLKPMAFQLPKSRTALQLPNCFLTHQRAKKNPSLPIYLTQNEFKAANKDNSPASRGMHLASIPACRAFTLSRECSFSLPTYLLLSLKLD